MSELPRDDKGNEAMKPDCPGIAHCLKAACMQYDRCAFPQAASSAIAPTVTLPREVLSDLIAYARIHTVQNVDYGNGRSHAERIKEAEEALWAASSSTQATDASPQTQLDTARAGLHGRQSVRPSAGEAPSVPASVGRNDDLPDIIHRARAIDEGRRRGDAFGPFPANEALDLASALVRLADREALSAIAQQFGEAMNFAGISFRNGYLQTWALASRLNRLPLVGVWLGAALRSLCGLLTGHRASKTEWGYGGGDAVDVWCRWCNQAGAMPRSAALDKFENMRSTIWKAAGCDISKTDAFPAAGTLHKESK